ncbi:hypothetical protein THAOC_23206 [Thalassiosira oceanica]|uniref:Uncharacterized protein n=1 Tax=Thalassiosira oceanica TaxID=159749 RepID=K0SDV2_THAOC|nr:hypothetical protein THAOC_23206 [Thalassiosira oceanica]|eukprot:EJK56827.1 hypothetical protein THAOC_23206 [Thalassiosira oceanica]
MTFTLPYEVKDNADGGTSCSDDFFLAIKTDGKPNETSWNVVNRETGEKVLEGGNYEEPWAVYTQRACLPAGNYTLNMKDSGDDGLSDVGEGKGFFVLSQYGKTIVDSNGQIGSMKSFDFEVTSTVIDGRVHEAGVPKRGKVRQTTCDRALREISPPATSWTCPKSASSAKNEIIIMLEGGGVIDAKLGTNSCNAENAYRGSEPALLPFSVSASPLLAATRRLLDFAFG